MKRIIYTVLTIFFVLTTLAQELDISKMTAEDVMNLTYDQLLEMPFEDVLKLADIVGVSLEELYEMLLNKDVVSASKKVESSFEAPLSTSVVSYDEIVASGARSVEEALRLVPGLIIREKTNGNFDVHIRGNQNLPPNHMFLYSENSITLVMIDGRPVYNYAHGGTFWETLPIGIDDIDRIEVVRGPSSALYGPNAVSGVVNIITKKQTEKKLKVNANVQGGSQSTAIASLAVGKKITDKLAFKVTGNAETMNRNQNKLWTHKANNGQGGWLPKETVDTLTEYYVNKFTDVGDTYYVFDPSDGVDDMYPDPWKARERIGGNGYLFYDLKDDISFTLKGGAQYSEVLSSTMADNATAQTGRVSQTHYADFNATVKGLKAQVNYLGGMQDIVRQDTGFKIDIKNINANAEYDFHIGTLNIRPGVSYQMAESYDLKYMRYDGQGFLNGRRYFTSTAASLRIDYTAFDRLRFIGAIRGEKYNTHEDLYISYQLIGAYNINDQHLIRVVNSKANRGPFLVDSYANFLWDREGRTLPGHIYFEGQENLGLLTMNMFEIGYRVKPNKSIQIDVENFINVTDNYGALYPDSVHMIGLNTDPTDVRPYVRMKYRNIDMRTAQLGLTGTISWVVTKDFIVKAFGTYQVTALAKSPQNSPDEDIQLMLIDAAFDSTRDYSTNLPNVYEDIENRATPNFFGGVTLDYTFREKFNFYATGYYYGITEFNSKYGTQNIDPKLILNLKVSYDAFKSLTVFGNIRNLLGEKQEFAYMDNIGTLYLLGLTINY